MDQKKNIGQAVQAAATQSEPAAPVAAPTNTGFTLPDLGAPPDEAAPEFQGETGKKKYADALSTYQHKMQVHQAFQDLDKLYTEAYPQRDFRKEYEDLVAMQKQQETQAPRESPLSVGLTTLADFNPAVQQAGRSLAGEYKAGVAQAKEESNKSFAQRMLLRARMHEAAAEDAAAKGNWKRALAEKEKLALLKIDAEELEHKRAMEKETARQEGATARANIRRDAAEKTATIRANAIGASHGLSGSFLAMFKKEAAKAVARLLGPRDLTKEYTPADVETLTDYLEQLAELFHDQQFGTEDGGEGYMRTPPSKRGQGKPKEKF